MIDLKNLKPDVIYRSQTVYRLPTKIKDAVRGTVYVPVTKTTSNTASFFTRPNIRYRFLNLYFHERVFNYKIYNSLIKYRIKENELREYFKNTIEPKMPNLTLALTKAKLVRRNYIHELANFQERFFSYKDSRVGMRRTNEYFRLFKLFTADKIDSKDYENKIMLIPIDEWITNPKDPKNYRVMKTDNFISLFYNKLASDPDYFKNTFGDWKFYFFFANQCFLWLPSEAHAKSAEEFRLLMYKLHLPKRTRQVSSGSQNKSTGSQVSQPLPEDLVEEEEDIIAKNRTLLTDKVEEMLQKLQTEFDDEVLDNLVDKVIEKGQLDISEDDEKLPDIDIDKLISPKELELEQIQSTMEEIVPKSSGRLAREVKLVQNMKNLELDGVTLDEIQARANANKIETTTLPVDVVNPKLKELTFPNFDEAYLKNLYQADIAKIMTGLQYKDRPLYLIESQVKDVSDALNKMEEYTFKFEDEAGRRHTFSVLLPKVINNRFMKIGGNKKIMVNQIVSLPVIKTGPDTVQISSNYQKVFIHRFGQSISPKVSVFFKSLGETFNKDVKVDIGGSTRVNRGIVTTIEYDELAAKYKKLELPHIEFFFNQKELREKLTSMKKPIPDPVGDRLPIAIRGGKEVVYLDTETGIVEKYNKQFIDYIVDEIAQYEPKVKDNFKTIKPGRRYMYSRANIMAKKVPLVLLLSFLDGILTMMKKANIDYRIISKDDSKRMPPVKKGEEDVIEFQDAWLIYPIYPLRNSLLMNGFYEIPTKIYNIEQFLSKDVYYELFETLFGRKNIGRAFENYRELLIDPITEDVLRDFNLPTEFVELFLYANTLLEDNSFNEDGDMNVHRVRSNEMISGFLYKTLAEAYENYRLTADNPNPVKVSTKKDAVIAKILTSQVTKDYSDLNPIYTAELKYSTTWKGLGGMNKDQAFNLSKRAFHPSMLGIISQASPISDAIGIARTLTIDSNVVSARGYMQTTSTPEDINKLPSTKLISSAEALIPFGPTSDDPERTAMTSAQSRHTIACVGSDRAPVGTGFEKVLPHLIGDTFVFKAKKDGKVQKIDEDTNIMILQYKDGTYDTVNLNPDMGKNSGSGFFISNKLSPTMKVGKSFKAGELVAHNNEFFTTDKRTGQSVFMAGPLARIAFRYSSKVIEDSTIVSTRLAEKMSSHIVVKRDIALGKNSNIDFMVKKGQQIKVNDPLLIFDTSHDDELTNKILAKIGDESTEDLIEASKRPIVSKWNGVIEDIKIYYTVPKDELSESARKIIQQYENQNKAMVRGVTKETGLKPEEVNVSLTEVEQVTPDLSGKVKGVKVGEGLLIEIYIKYKDVFGVGDKLTSLVATKAIACDIFEEGEEPYLLSNPDDKIDAYIGVISVGARKVASLLKTSQVNAIVIGMKDNIRKMYEEIYDEKLPVKK